MDKKKIITIISIVVTIIVVAVAAVLIIHRNNTLSTKTVASGSNINENEDLNTEEPTDETSDNPTDEPTETPTAKATTSPLPKVSNETGKYYIKVNNQANTITIYTKDEAGNYTIPVKAMVCSTGYASPKNSKYQTKGKWTWGRMLGNVYTQWETLITGNILFHSVPYLTRYDPNSLEYWEYNKLGTTCSAGCIRLSCADALWIYTNCAVGTWVEFYSDPNPGPLGKPSAQKIPTDSPYKGWDPTDTYNKGNPWLTAPIDTPSPEPTIEPTTEPTTEPTPVVTPTEVPTTDPTQTPTEEPTEEPTITPEVPTPTEVPIATPTQNVTTTPTENNN